MSTINDLMDSPVRQVLGKVEIVYSDAIVDPSIQATSMDTGYATNIDTLYDGKVDATQKWFSLHDNVLDGSFKLLHANSSGVGWWSNEISESDGYFVTALEISIHFDSRTVSIVEIYSDAIANVYPVDFEIALLNASGVAVHMESIYDNDNVAFIKQLDTPVDNVTRMILTIYSINKAYYTCRILEFFNAIRFIYTNDLVSIDILEEIEYATGELTLGAISSNEITVALKNQDRLFDVNNINSPLKSFLKKNRKVKCWLGVVDTDDTTIWELIGTYWSVAWNAPRQRFDATMIARDLLESMRTSQFKGSAVLFDNSFGDLFERVLVDFGLQSTDWVIDQDLYGIQIPIAWFPLTTHREALRRLAKAIPVDIYINRLGQLQIDYIIVANAPEYTFRDTTTLIDYDFPYAWNDTVNHVNVQVNRLTLQASKQLYHSTETIVIAAGSSIELICNFSDAPGYAISNAVVTLTGSASVGQLNYAWGSILTISANTITTVTEISISGTFYSITDTSIISKINPAAITSDGDISVDYGNELIQTTAYATYLAEFILHNYADAKHDVKMHTRGNIALKLNDEIAIEGVAYPYKVVRQDITWDGALRATIDAKVITEV